MDLALGTGKKHRNTGGISSIFAEAMRQIGGVYGGRAMNQRFPKWYYGITIYDFRERAMTTKKEKIIDVPDTSPDVPADSARAARGRRAAKKNELNIDAILARLFISTFKVEERAIAESSSGKISISELHVLREIGMGSARTMTQIARGLKISVSALTIAMNKLEKKRYVRRERDTEDHRIVKVSLTDDGIEAFEYHDAFHKKMVDDALSQLTDEERDVLWRTLVKLDAYFAREWARHEKSRG
jgi:DNA-binding MarR family transcriptional regulator